MRMPKTILHAYLNNITIIQTNQQTNKQTTSHYINRVNLVLGYGLNSVDYRGQTLWVFYRETITSAGERVERMTLFAKPHAPPPLQGMSQHG
jgi:hypothetical protein